MTKTERLTNRCFAVVFVALGTGAFIGAAFCGATHQFFIAGVCALMVWALLAETKEKKVN